MKLWKRINAVLKDKNSICIAKLARRTAFRNPELETAVIKATSHDEFSIDYKNSKRIFSWIKASPSFLKPVIWALATRVEKTRCWVVALKGLMLMHGIMCCKISAVNKIGRLPFDLSNFKDGHINSQKLWGFNAFIRAYFAFLDQRAAFELSQQEKEKQNENTNVIQFLDYLQRLQVLLDLLLQTKPYKDVMNPVLILEAMDCIIIEVFDIYSRICNGIAEMLVGIYDASKDEATKALSVLHKAASQGADLESYFELCRDIGVLKASEFPKVEQIPDADIRDLERIIDGVTEKKEMDTFHKEEMLKKNSLAIVEAKKDETNLLKTIITDQWVLFDDEFKVDEREILCLKEEEQNNSYEDPFVASLNAPPLLYTCNNGYGYGYGNGYGNFNGFQQYEQCYDPMWGNFSMPTQGNQMNMILSA